MTEKEAKTKWCKDRSMRYQLININGFIAAHLADSADNKAAIVKQVIKNQNTEDNNCIASDCMMWEWGNVDQNGNTSGYCGLSCK